MSITTKTGDQGQTQLGSGRVGKDHLTIQLIGEIDELQSVLGMFKAEINNLPAGRQVTELKIKISEIQKDLYVINGEMSGFGGKLDYDQKLIEMEELINKWEGKLPVLKEFIIPGENQSEALAHFARSVCRRVERSVVGLKKQKDINFNAIRYFNRLSDYLFMVARLLRAETKKI
ncbi:MAG: cob(I)yrinic acid a,c-diamide adenosyltransferase [Candidatus Shapirobacteria bacterium]|nr:cob(I)yrinic acid a,c-diamide adenosyltransferase [Candidatus Shapirobacteria bacterium]